MTFLSPDRLLLLIAPVVLFVAYVVVQRTRQRVVVRFTDVDLLSSVAPRRPGWQRHIANGLMLAAVVLMTVAFARPASTDRVPRERATIVMALDTSASMAAADVAPSRLEAAKRQAGMFVSKLPRGLQIGLVTFDTSARVLVSPTSDRTTVQAALGTLTTGSGTATGAAIDLALDAIKALPKTSTGKASPAVIVLMSDGTPTIGNGDLSPSQAADDAAAAARQAGVPVDTIAFGTAQGIVEVQGQVIPVPSDPAAMARIARDSGGKAFTAQSASQLRSVYDQIGRAVGYEVHRHEITAWFVGAALAAALLAAAAALVWSQRLL